MIDPSAMNHHNMPKVSKKNADVGILYVRFISVICCGKTIADTSARSVGCGRGVKLGLVGVGSNSGFGIEFGEGGRMTVRCLETSLKKGSCVMPRRPQFQNPVAIYYLVTTGGPKVDGLGSRASWMRELAASIQRPRSPLIAPIG